MIVRMTGMLAEVGETSAIVDRDGIGYEMMVPGYALPELASRKGESVTFYTLEYYEGSAAGGNLTPRLIGFLHPADRAFFSKFVKVKGIGMRKALKALAEPMARTASAIEGGDAAMLGRLPGIGKRAAEQIIAELRGKVKAFATGEAADGDSASVDWTDDQRDALEILVGALRERREDAERWLARAGMSAAEPTSAEEWVKAAYRVRSGSEG